MLFPNHETIKISVIILAFLGLLDSLYLYISHVAGASLVCGPLVGCNEVAASPYSLLFGIPLSLLGVLFYGGMFVLAAALFSHYRGKAMLLFLVGAILGSLMSLYFLYVQGALIGAWCVYCILSALISFLLCGASVYLYKNKPSLTESV